MDLTPKEILVLQDIVNSEYQDGDPVNTHIWLDYVINTRSRGGVLQSLSKKGLIDYTIVPKSESSNRGTGISDSTICITAAGLAALGVQP